jgi:hypothetical protein
MKVMIDAAEVGLGVIEVILTAAQKEHLLPLVRRQLVVRKGLVMVSVAPHFIDGEPVLRLQAQYLRQPAAAKVSKIMAQERRGKEQMEMTI